MANENNQNCPNGVCDSRCRDCMDMARGSVTINPVRRDYGRHGGEEDEFPIASLNKCVNAHTSQTLGKIQNISGENLPKDYAETLGKTENSLGQNGNKFNAETILNLLLSERGQYPCLDKTIVAVIFDGGSRFIGINGMRKDASVCQRNQANHKINSGYGICKSVCEQNAHAERDAISRWIASGMAYRIGSRAEIAVYGAKRLCNDCRTLCAVHGITIKGVYPDLDKFLECL